MPANQGSIQRPESTPPEDLPTRTQANHPDEVVGCGKHTSRIPGILPLSYGGQSLLCVHMISEILDSTDDISLLLTIQLVLTRPQGAMNTVRGRWSGMFTSKLLLTIIHFGAF